MTSPTRTPFAWPGLLAGLCLGLLLAPTVQAQGLDKRLREAEEKRIAVIEKVKPSVVAVLNAQGNNGGSGVVIDENGYALTNFHVVAATGPVMKCGLADGKLYDGVVVGIDKVGDVALIKLLPKKPGNKFAFSRMGDSDKVKAGDWSLAMGNPFLLATDFTPTVTFGLISGVHRYQYPEGALLEYTDCIQIDTSINPGNSGGPLFNMDGEVIGINGRGSFEKRSRINSGVGYAISINQIKNFMGHLRAGLDVDHASLGARIESEDEDGSLNKMVVRALLECDAARRGLDNGDQLVSFANRPMGSVNEFKNVLGLFPRGWRVPLVYRRDNSSKAEILVRLMGVQRQVVEDDKNPQPQPGPRPRPGPQVPSNSPAAKLYEPKAGFANFHFNKLERDRLLAAFRKQGDFSAFKGEWDWKGSGEAQEQKTIFEVNVRDEKTADGKGTQPVVRLSIRGLDYKLEPLQSKLPPGDLKAPAKSGGFITAMYHYRQLLVMGEKGFEGDFSHGGYEPMYMPTPAGQKPDYTKQRIMTEVLRTRHAGTSVKWFFSQADGTLVGFEVTVDRDEDPCEVYLSDYKAIEGGQKLPHRIQVHHGNENYCDLKVEAWKLAK